VILGFNSQTLENASLCGNGSMRENAAICGKGLRVQLAVKVDDTRPLALIESPIKHGYAT